LSRLGLYIHFPFCRRRCPYCHFFHVPADPDRILTFIQDLCSEIDREEFSPHSIDTIYFGGGSPSLLTAGQIGKILDAVSRRFTVVANPEISIEFNPEEAKTDFLNDLKKAGINRISLGVQSFQEKDLLYLGRLHTPQLAEKAVHLAHACGFRSVSIDLIIGLPRQTVESLEANFTKAGRLAVTHVSVYLLEGVRGKRVRSSGNKESTHYLFAIDRLQTEGFTQYEISNFARPGQCCRHNLKYWRNEPYLAFGPSAARYTNGCDEVTTADIKLYHEALARGKRPPFRRRSIPVPTRRIICGLRLNSGLPWPAFSGFSEPAGWLLENGLLVARRGRLAVPTEKMLLLNEILTHLI